MLSPHHQSPDYEIRERMLEFSFADKDPEAAPFIECLAPSSLSLDMWNRAFLNNAQQGTQTDPLITFELKFRLSDDITALLAAGVNDQGLGPVLSRPIHRLALFPVVTSLRRGRQAGQVNTTDCSYTAVGPASWPSAGGALLRAMVYQGEHLLHECKIAPMGHAGAPEALTFPLTLQNPAKANTVAPLDLSTVLLAPLLQRGLGGPDLQGLTFHLILASPRSGIRGDVDAHGNLCSYCLWLCLCQHYSPFALRELVRKVADANGYVLDQLIEADTGDTASTGGPDEAATAVEPGGIIVLDEDDEDCSPHPNTNHGSDSVRSHPSYSLVLSHYRNLRYETYSQRAGYSSDANIISLRCPLTYGELSKPCRGASCVHLAAFGLDSYIECSIRYHCWNCPICGAPARPNQLISVSFISDIKARLCEEGYATLDRCDSVRIIVVGREQAPSHLVNYVHWRGRWGWTPCSRGVCISQGGQTNNNDADLDAKRYRN